MPPAESGRGSSRAGSLGRPSPLRGQLHSPARVARTQREYAAARAAGFTTPYELRRARGEALGFTLPQIRGHAAEVGQAPRSAERPTFYQVPIALGAGRSAPTELIDVPARHGGQAARLGAYMSDVGALLDGRLGGSDFETKWRGRRIAGRQVEYRPARVAEIMRQQGPPPGSPRYRRLRPGEAVLGVAG